MADRLECECKCSYKHTNRNCHAGKYVCDVVPPHTGARREKHRAPGTRRDKDRSPERRICDECCRLLKNCSCRRKSDSSGERRRGDPAVVVCRCRPKPTADSSGGRPLTLRESLPLYDERCHLLGYIQAGARLDLPACPESEDPALPSVAPPTDLGCLPSCGYAAGAKRGAGGGAAPRWTTRAAFRHATAASSPRKKCPYD